ncbi:hypothetical protein [Deinococcus multiflagellatus]|uniref:Uncharacterized protein n=1 Tax=Deinococcus multiflagellatus TaxID=1656887 RepID=A0ABW1ZJU9_9DEIO
MRAAFKRHFPEVQLLSALEECLALGDAALVRDLMASASAPTAEDLRVLGIAHRLLGDVIASEQTLERAIAQGAAAARIDLARTYSLTERKEDAWQELQLLDIAALPAQDQAYAYRLRAELRSDLDSFEAALPDARLACRIANGLPQRAVVLPWCQITLAVTYEQLGEDHRALHLLEQLGELPVYGYPYHLVNSARVLLQLGRLEDARALILYLRTQVHTAQARRTWQRLQADLLWLQGDLSAALAVNQQAAQDAERDFNALQAVKAYLRVALLAAHLGAPDTALRALARAEVLAGSRGMRSLVLGYGASVRLRLGHLTPEAALQTLHAARDQLAQRAERPDERDMQLHACEAARHLGPEALARELEHLRALMRAAGHPAMLARSWHLLPDLAAQLRPGDPALLGPAVQPPALRLLTLNRADLMRGDRVVRLGVRRGVEVLAYLLHFGPRSLELILRDVFGDLDRTKGRNQFHQLRLRLRELAPELSLEYGGGLYHLRGQEALWWDVTGTAQPNMAHFLPACGSDWAQELALAVPEAGGGH